ncbi:hypothetical protein ES703_07324 [subsurface metagenome]
MQKLGTNIRMLAILLLIESIMFAILFGVLVEVDVSGR